MRRARRLTSWIGIAAIASAVACGGDGAVGTATAASGAGGAGSRTTSSVTAIGGGGAGATASAGGATTSSTTWSTTSAGGGGGAAPCVGCARDWSRWPALVEMDGVSTLVALSDVHGDYAAYVQLLVGAGVLAAAPNAPAAAAWSGGGAVLVVVGDLIDKGPDALDVLRLTQALTAAAANAGGRVVVTMGNHEAEFLADPTNAKASAADGLDPELANAGESPASVASGATPEGAFLRTLPFAARVGPWFFAHAGPTGGRTAADLDSALRADVDAHGFGAPLLADPGSILEAHPPKKPPAWWDATGDAPALLDAWLAALGAKHLVIGHEPGTIDLSDGTKRARDELTSAFGGRLWFLDTGSSVDVDATGGAALRVEHVGTADERVRVRLPDGSEHKP